MVPFTMKRLLIQIFVSMVLLREKMQLLGRIQQSGDSLKVTYTERAPSNIFKRRLKDEKCQINKILRYL